LLHNALWKLKDKENQENYEGKEKFYNLERGDDSENGKESEASENKELSENEGVIKEQSDSPKPLWYTLNIAQIESLKREGRGEMESWKNNQILPNLSGTH
jgi:hypothetical protein